MSKRIIAGLIIGIILAVTVPDAAQPITIFGTLFVGALKAVAPILVFSWLHPQFRNFRKRPTDEHEICHRTLPFKNLGGTRSRNHELPLPGDFICRYGDRISALWGVGGDIRLASECRG